MNLQLNDPRTNWKFIAIVVVLGLISVGGILILRGKLASSSVSEGKALVYGKAVALSDVQTIPDAPLKEGIIGAISEDRFDSFVTEARQAEAAFLSQTMIFSYVVNSSSFDEQGDFQFELDPGLYVLCYFSPMTSSEAMRLETCGKTHLETGEQLSIQIGKMFAASITGRGVETIPLADIYPITSDSSNTSDFTLSEVEGWKTYRNEEFGFEVRYPKDSFFEASIFGRELRLSYKKGGESLGRFSITTRATDKKNISEVPIPMNSGYTKVGPYDTIQSLPDSPPFSWNNYLFIGNGKEYNLYIEWYQTKDKEDFDQILSTFRFVK